MVVAGAFANVLITLCLFAGALWIGIGVAIQRGRRKK